MRFAPGSHGAEASLSWAGVSFHGAATGGDCLFKPCDGFHQNRPGREHKRPNFSLMKTEASMHGTLFVLLVWPSADSSSDPQVIEY